MSDDLERLRRFRADEPPPSQEAISSAREHLAALIASAPAAPTLGRRPRPTRSRTTRWWRRPAIFISLAAACAAALVLAIATNSPFPTPALAAQLQRLANIAAGQSPVTAPPNGHYLYVDSLQANQDIAAGNGTSCTALVPERRQLWIGANGAGRLLETTRPASFPTARDRAICQQMHATPRAGTSDLWFAPRCFSLGLGSQLPPGSFKNPARLLADMRKLDGGPKSPAEDFVHIGDVLRESDDSPALRAAIYRAAATIPGVKLLGPTPDHLGRRGVGIGYPGHGAIHELIFNPHTSALLGEQTINTTTGQTLDWAAYLTSQIVNHIPTKPPGRLDRPCINYGGYMHTRADGVTVMTGAPLKH